MTKQAFNCIGLLKGQPVEKITQALNFLQASVVNELMEHFQVNNKADLASKLNAL